MKRFFFSLILLASPAFAAPGDAPTMNPTSEATPASSPGSSLGFQGLTKERPKGAKTEITAKKQATFDNASNIAEFEGNVVVVDPQFKLFCDRLKVTLGANRKGLELVEAFGKVILVQDNVDSNGKVVRATGRAEQAIYDPKTGNITLKIWPSVQHGVNLQEATEEGTIMILNRAGKSETQGPSKTSIIDSGETKSPLQ